MARDDLGDRDTDKTIENAAELGGGYGGPFPADPEEEGDEGTEADEAQSPT